tara:strand:- start:144 stop:788 length:645 start_codon:yes stop_codon:yes gene_type:complete
MTDTHEKVDQQDQTVLNTIWQTNENSNNTKNRQLLGLSPITLDKVKVYQFTVFYTGRELNKALKDTGLKNWSIKKIKKYDEENGTNHSGLLANLKDKTAANTIRSICLHCFNNLDEWEAEIKETGTDKINSLESFYKKVKSRIGKTEETEEAAETSETEETEEAAETEETLPELETVEDYGIAIAALVLSGQARGYDKGEMIQIAVDVIKSKKK